MLNVAVNIGQTWRDFSSLNDQTGCRLDSLASSVSRYFQDRARGELTSLVVGDAIETQTLSNQNLGQIASLYNGPLEDASIAVFDPVGRVLATSTPLTDRHGLMV
jgi:hypothetical protein